MSNKPHKIRCPRCGRLVRRSSGDKVFRHDAVYGRECGASAESVEEVLEEQAERLDADPVVTVDDEDAEK